MLWSAGDPHWGCSGTICSACLLVIVMEFSCWCCAGALIFFWVRVGGHSRLGPYGKYPSRAVGKRHIHEQPIVLLRSCWRYCQGRSRDDCWGLLMGSEWKSLLGIITWPCWRGTYSSMTPAEIPSDSFQHDPSKNPQRRFPLRSKQPYPAMIPTTPAKSPATVRSATPAELSNNVFYYDPRKHPKRRLPARPE